MLDGDRGHDRALFARVAALPTTLAAYGFCVPGVRFAPGRRLRSTLVIATSIQETPSGGSSA
jgi:hypothetical protein